jgi:hypothetical protein
MAGSTSARRPRFQRPPPDRVFISSRQRPGSRRTQRRLQKYRTGAEGGISHLKRGYGMDRSVLASKAAKASRSGTDGRSSPTTLTRSPSGSGETLPRFDSTRAPIHYEPAALIPDRRGRFVSAPVRELRVIPRQVD